MPKVVVLGIQDLVWAGLLGGEYQCIMLEPLLVRLEKYLRPIFCSLLVHSCTCTCLFFSHCVYRVDRSSTWSRRTVNASYGSTGRTWSRSVPKCMHVHVSVCTCMCIMGMCIHTVYTTHCTQVSLYYALQQICS